MFIINLNISINDKKSSAKYSIKEGRTIEMNCTTNFDITIDKEIKKKRI